MLLPSLLLLPLIASPSFTETAATAGAGVLNVRAGARAQAGGGFRDSGPLPGSSFGLGLGLSDWIQLDARLVLGGLDAGSSASQICIAEHAERCQVSSRPKRQLAATLRARIGIASFASGLALGLEGGGGYRTYDLSLGDTYSTKKQLLLDAGPIASWTVGPVLLFARAGGDLRVPVSKRSDLVAAPYAGLGAEYAIALAERVALAPYLELGVSDDDGLLYSASLGMSLLADVFPKL